MDPLLAKAAVLVCILLIPVQMHFIMILIKIVDDVFKVPILVQVHHPAHYVLVRIIQFTTLNGKCHIY